VNCFRISNLKSIFLSFEKLKIKELTEAIVNLITQILTLSCSLVVLLPKNQDLTILRPDIETALT